MDSYVSLITLGVEDVERSRRFYVDGLGWEPKLALDEVVFIQVGHGLLLSLWQLDDMASDTGVTITKGNSVQLAHNVGSEAEVVAAIELVRAAGANVIQEPRRAFYGGLQAYFADPDGYVWEVAHNDGITVGADGTVSISAPS